MTTGIVFSVGCAGLRARRVRAAPPFPFNVPSLSVWHNGRAAIWQGVRRLGLEAGDRVLVPAYSCGSELDALIKAGLTVDSYRALPDLSPDLNHLAELIRSPAHALYVTHYFGFPQPMAPLADFANRNNLFLIEDTTHGLYSLDSDGRPLGTAGDLSIFSFPKFLPLPDGGCYVLGAAPSPTDPPVPSRAPETSAIAGKVKGLLEAEMLRRFPAGGAFVKTRVITPPVEFVKRCLYPDYRPGPEDDVISAFGGRNLEPDRADWGMSGLSKFLLGRIDHSQIAPARQRNYRALDAHFHGGDRVRPLLGPLPDGACPWVYPLWAQDVKALRNFMASHRIECGLFWIKDYPAVPLDDFPFERNLRQHVAILPLHQGLTVDNMTTIADLLNQWNRMAPGTIG
ncbi:MAG: DegT/DnrJ/EryC1/StrS family aminotransferase [Rhodospirillales bacterium]|nr:DegT/DnrJ/EryC1/StrS family aminotransferase [Rhodospirillales bacterium]